jgi:hypothetical protein
MVMNGGMDHAFEALTREEIQTGARGLSYFDLEPVASLLEEALRVEVGNYESFDEKYWSLVPTDDTLVRAFEAMYSDHPDRFSPLEFK